MKNTSQQKIAAPRRERSSSSSSSSSSSCSSNSSSSTSSSPRPKRSRKHKKKKGGKNYKRSRRKLKKPSKEINKLKEQLNQPSTSKSNLELDDSVLIISDCSRELYSANESAQPELFNFNIETKLKDPAIPKASESDVLLLGEIQKLGHKDWSEIRYAEVQKAYNRSPGFIALEVNEEVRAYDSLRHLAYADKSYAALTLCMLKQREALQSVGRAQDSILIFDTTQTYGKITVTFIHLSNMVSKAYRFEIHSPIDYGIESV
ncbi:hypothetical protein JYU34_010525 [Plutella xylostella]|uniref:Uncharacterized protein n=1 Tax=Plutella xylostella TaxID=51655 RepID=A0ABQ7QIK4_PLUXY|nr:hypothetical protein JYU34_010525 [Plutella xylostella]